MVVVVVSRDGSGGCVAVVSRLCRGCVAMVVVVVDGSGGCCGMVVVVVWWLCRGCVAMRCSGKIE